MESDIREYLARAAKPDGKCRTEEEQLRFLSQKGAKILKRKLLGLCGTKAIKSLEEIASVLLETGVAYTVAEARELVPALTKSRSIHYGGSPYKGIHFLTFYEVKTCEGNTKYKVSAWTDNRGYG